MSTPKIITTLALETDGPALATLTTHAFSNSDAAYPLIWGNAAPGLHDSVALAGLLTPVQKSGVVVYKAVDSTTDTIVGFVKWLLPKPKVEGEAVEAKKGGGGMPDLPGVNMELWNAKNMGPNSFATFATRDQDLTQDWHLSLCFVHPDFQRRGIASLLLAWGVQEADKAQAKIWCMSTPQAIKTYEKHGWEVVDWQEVDLEKYGGEGIYKRAWMVRLPKPVAV